MNRWRVSVRLLLVLLVSCAAGAQTRAYLGFDRNDYPGDAALDGLRASFRYTSYWLNDPPGEKTNSWTGKRLLLKHHGFGFLVLFNGRLSAQVKGKDAAALGTADGKAAVAAARKEGFPDSVLIFLDQEEGGRLLPEQSDYLWAWVNAVRVAGARAGVYCSGIDVPDGNATISTARDLIEQEKMHTFKNARLALWVANDQCPPAPGCAKTDKLPTAGGTDGAAVWQYAQSPRRTAFSAGCPNNAATDGNCYATGMPRNADTFLDLDTANSADPSGGR